MGGNLKLTVGLLLIATGALAHTTGPGSWIGREGLSDPVTKLSCCNEYDCVEDTPNIETVAGGFRIKSTGEIIPVARVIWRSPGGWWRCVFTAGEDAGKTRCLIGPPTSG